MCDSMMVTVLVTQTANWVKLFGSFGFCFLCRLVSFVYGCILDTINQVSVVCVHGFHPLSCAPVLWHWSVCLSRLKSFFCDLLCLDTSLKHKKKDLLPEIVPFQVENKNGTAFSRTIFVLIKKVACYFFYDPLQGFFVV